MIHRQYPAFYKTLHKSNMFADWLGISDYELGLKYPKLINLSGEIIADTVFGVSGIFCISDYDAEVIRIPDEFEELIVMHVEIYGMHLESEINLERCK